MDPRNPPRPAAHSPSLHPSLFPLSVWPFYVKLNPTTATKLLFASSEIICRRPIVPRRSSSFPFLRSRAIYYYPLSSIACLSMILAIQLSEPELCLLSYFLMLHLTIQLLQICRRSQISEKISVQNLHLFFNLRNERARCCWMKKTLEKNIQRSQRPIDKIDQLTCALIHKPQVYLKRTMTVSRDYGISSTISSFFLYSPGSTF